MMARNPRIQLPFSESFYKRIENYKRENEFDSITDAARDLIEFALAIKERTANDDSRTTRELMEEMLAKEYQNEATLNQLYLYIYDKDKQFEQGFVDITIAKLKGLKEKSFIKLQKFLNREE